MSGFKEEQLAELNHANPDVRLTAIRALRDSGRDHLMEPIANTALHDPVAYIRSEAIEALAVINDPGAIDALAAILENDVTRYVRWKAAEALGRIRGEEASVPLLQALSDSDPDIVWKAAESLGRRRETGAVEPLIRLLGHADMYVQEKAAEALGDIGDHRALEALRSVVNDETTVYSLDHQRFRLAAAAAVEKLNSNPLRSGS